jgi:adenylate kinase family enzyme
MPLLSSADPLPHAPARVLVAGPSGVGKTHLAAHLGALLDLPHTEIDALYHGPNWTPRLEFADDVARFAATPRWITEWQYPQVMTLLAERADLLVWLDHPRRTVLRRVVARTVRRRFSRTELWNGNTEGPLWTFLTDRDHIVRWSWRVYGRYQARVPALLKQPGSAALTIVRLRGQREVDAWLAGPLRGADPGRPARLTREVHESSTATEATEHGGVPGERAEH